ncbi:hypothetical protein KM043_015841 [Ampulex compressa]|nr:hypothetical protein KM043_015841 [Ampulex compressa]
MIHVCQDEPSHRCPFSDCGPNDRHCSLHFRVETFARGVEKGGEYFEGDSSYRGELENLRSRGARELKRRFKEELRIIKE